MRSSTPISYFLGVGWKLFLLSLGMMGSNIQAKDYQFIAPSSANWSSTTATNWNQSSPPWDGTPPAGGPTGADNLQMVATGALQVDGARSILNLDAASSGQLLRGATLSDNLSILNDLSVTGSGASLTLWNGSTNSAFSVEVAGDVEIGSGSTVYLGNLSNMDFRRALAGFDVAGATAVSGTLVNHTLNTVGNSTISLGALNVTASGALIGASDGGSGVGGARVLTISAQSLTGSGVIYGSSSLNLTAGYTRDVTVSLVNATVTTTTYSGVLRDSSVVNANNRLHLAVAIQGSQTLTGNNTYTGATTITSGTLIIGSTGSINGTSGVILDGGKLEYAGTTALNRGVALQGGNFGYHSASNYSGALTFTSGTLSGTNWKGNLGGMTIGTGQVISPGNSPGLAETTSQIWASGGTYLWEMNDASGSAGADPGWDLFTGSGSLTITATTEWKFSFQITSLTLENTSGAAANFNSLADGAWLVADFSEAIVFDATVFDIDTSAFLNPFTGGFALQRGDAVGLGGDHSQLYLIYTAVPEPSSVVLLGTLTLFGAAALRRNRRTIHRKGV